MRHTLLVLVLSVSSLCALCTTHVEKMLHHRSGKIVFGVRHPIFVTPDGFEHAISRSDATPRDGYENPITDWIVPIRTQTI